MCVVGRMLQDMADLEATDVVGSCVHGYGYGDKNSTSGREHSKDAVTEGTRVCGRGDAALDEGGVVNSKIEDMDCVIKDEMDEDTDMAAPPATMSVSVSVSAWGVWSMAIFLSCPIGNFCSQKNWIDNCLMMTVALAVTCHIVMWHLYDTYRRGMWMCSQKETRQTQSGLRQAMDKDSTTHRVVIHFLSGLFFGMCALNTKITALGALPCILAWSVMVEVLYGYCLHRVPLAGRIRRRDCAEDPIASPRSVPQLHQSLGRAAANIICFLVGVAFGHGPWVILYYVSLFDKLLAPEGSSVYVPLHFTPLVGFSLLCYVSILCLGIYRKDIA